MISSLYKPINPDIWKGRVDSVSDSSQFRWHQVVQCMNLSELDGEQGKVLLGFSSDIGVARNQGRPGAAEGPDYFRKSAGSLCWHGDGSGFADVGNIQPEGNNLEEAQKQLGSLMNRLLQKHKTCCILGGGHETAFGHYLGIASYLKQTDPKAKLGIINIDAHFDLRSYEEMPSSGSPFLQALDHAGKNNLEVEYFVYGINVMNNTKSLFNTADRLGVEYVTNREIYSHSSQSIGRLRSFIQAKTHLYLTICLDVFDASIAPGVSAPAWHGIQLHHALDVLKLVKNSGKMISMDVCELNPAYDSEQKTMRTAAMLVAEFLG